MFLVVGCVEAESNLLYITMCELVGGDKVLIPLNGEHVLSLTYLPIKSNSPFNECEFYL
jgi:hypothetical protein